MGTYKELSQDKEGAFAKLMEWQMQGGSIGSGEGSRIEELGGELSEEEALKVRLDEIREEEEAEGQKEAVGEGEKVRGDKETAPEVVLERTKGKDSQR